MTQQQHTDLDDLGFKMELSADMEPMTTKQVKKYGGWQHLHDIENGYSSEDTVLDVGKHEQTAFVAINGGDVAGPHLQSAIIITSTTINLVYHLLGLPFTWFTIIPFTSITIRISDIKY